MARALQMLARRPLALLITLVLLLVKTQNATPASSLCMAGCLSASLFKFRQAALGVSASIFQIGCRDGLGDLMAIMISDGRPGQRQLILSEYEAEHKQKKNNNNNNTIRGISPKPNGPLRPNNPCK